MYNLIQIQEEIKNLPMDKVMKYANGENAQVPPYIALAELNRRKHIEDTSKAFSNPGTPPTIKDQVQNSLAQPSQFAVNPAAAPRQVDMTRPQQPMVNPAQQAPQVAPGMAMGGLASIPTGNMFSSQSYAGGGIIAFAEGGEADVPPPNNTTSAGPFSLPQARQQQSPEQFLADRQKLKELAGVKSDPYEELKQRYAKTEARQASSASDDAINRIIANLSAISKAEPTTGIFAAMGEGAMASTKLGYEQEQLRDKQANTELELFKSLAKEDEARKMGDVNAYEQAKKDVIKNELDLEKIKIDQYNAQSHRMTAEKAGANAPTRDERLETTVMARINSDPRVKVLSKKMENLDPGTPEYNAAMTEINNISKAYYENAGLKAPYIAAATAPVVEKPEEKGFFSKIFGGDKKSQVIDFNKLPIAQPKQ